MITDEAKTIKSFTCNTLLNLSAGSIRIFSFIAVFLFLYHAFENIAHQNTGKLLLYKQYPPFGAKICWDIFAWALSVPDKHTVFRECSLRKTVPKDKYPSIFLSQMEAVVFIICQIFFTRCVVLKIGEYSWIIPSFS